MTSLITANSGHDSPKTTQPASPELPTGNQPCDSQTCNEAAMSQGAMSPPESPKSSSLNQYTTKCLSKSPNTPKEQRTLPVGATPNIPAPAIDAAASPARLVPEAYPEAEALAQLHSFIQQLCEEPQQSSEAESESQNDA